MTEFLPVKLSDPVYHEEQELYGVKNKQMYIADAASVYLHKPERRASRCVICKTNVAKFGKCNGVDGVECNCCNECRCDCYLVR